MKPNVKRCIAFQGAGIGEDVGGGRNVFSKGTGQRRGGAEQSSMDALKDADPRVVDR